MSYTHADFQKAGRCGRSVMYSTFKLCGIDPRSDEYDDQDMERFKLARQMKRERKNDEEIADYFKVDLRSASQKEVEENSGYVESEAEEATDIVDVQVAEAMIGMYRGSAKKLANAAPVLAARCIVEELNSKEVRQGFAQLRDQFENSGGNPTAFLLQMARNRPQIASSQNFASLPEASTESSEPDC